MPANPFPRQQGVPAVPAVGSLGDIEVGNRVVSLGGRRVFTMGTATASANNFVPPKNGLVFHVTGTTQINLISNLGASGGAPLTLIFDGILTVKNNQVASGDFKPILLNSGVDFTTAANSTLSLVYDSTNSKWLETGRKA